MRLLIQGGEKVCKARQRGPGGGSVYETYVTERWGRDNEAWRALSPPFYISGLTIPHPILSPAAPAGWLR